MLATDNAVIPYAVGVDIACRMNLTVYDRKANTLAGQRDRLANLIESETRFGMGCEFKQRREHEVMDEDWSVSPVTERLPGKAWAQLGMSGSDNHFVEFGSFTVESDAGRADGAGAENALGLPPGEYVALLSHSGSRGTGRVMSSTKALQSFTWSAVKKQLAAAGVELLSTGLDEVPACVNNRSPRAWCQGVR